MTLVITQLWNYLLPRPSGPLHPKLLPSGTFAKCTADTVSWEEGGPTLSAAQSIELRLCDLRRERHIWQAES